MNVNTQGDYVYNAPPKSTIAIVTILIIQSWSLLSSRVQDIKAYQHISIRTSLPII